MPRASKNKRVLRGGNTGNYPTSKFHKQRQNLQKQKQRQGQQHVQQPVFIEKSVSECIEASRAALARWQTSCKPGRMEEAVSVVRTCVDCIGHSWALHGYLAACLSEVLHVVLQFLFGRLAVGADGSQHRQQPQGDEQVGYYAKMEGASSVALSVDSYKAVVVLASLYAALRDLQVHDTGRLKVTTTLQKLQIGLRRTLMNLGIAGDGADLHETVLCLQAEKALTKAFGPLVAAAPEASSSGQGATFKRPSFGRRKPALRQHPQKRRNEQQPQETEPQEEQTSQDMSDAGGRSADTVGQRHDTRLSPRPRGADPPESTVLNLQPQPHLQQNQEQPSQPHLLQQVLPQGQMHPAAENGEKGIADADAEDLIFVATNPGLAPRRSTRNRNVTRRQLQHPETMPLHGSLAQQIPELSPNTLKATLPAVPIDISDGEEDVPLSSLA